MDFDNYFTSLVGNYSEQKTSSIIPIEIQNVFETKRQQKEVNHLILKNTMHQWTNVLDDQVIEDAKPTKTVDISIPGQVKSAWITHKEYYKEGSMGAGIMHILHNNNEKKSENVVNLKDEHLDTITQLKKERANRMHHEQMMSKSRMSHKIKSKNFHRHLKKRSLKDFLRNEEIAKKDNCNNLKDKLLEFEKLRAEERISLKHKVGGKFAKIQKLRAKYDAIARDALSDMRDKGKQLTERVVDMDDEEGDEDKEEEEIDEISDEEKSEISEQDEEMMAGINEKLSNSASHKANQFIERNKSQSNKTAVNTPVTGTISTSQSNFLNYDQLTIDQSDDVMFTDEARFKDAIYEIYQQDEELATQFTKDKSELVEKENPQDLQLFQPGWGAWTGPGFEAADKRRKQRGLVKAPDTNRKDKKKARVWIKEGVHDELKKHLIKTIPYPYNTADQFNLSRRELVSSVFNLQTVHRQLVKPKFTKKAGQPIYPRKKTFE